jgi:hypothetical protein
MTNIICVLYNDPVSGYPPSYARDSVPTIPDEYLIVDGGKLAGTGAHSYSAKG